MLINLRNALMAGKRLPYDAEVEYLESTGTQWINTGTPIAYNYRIELTFATTATGTQYIFGDSISGNSLYRWAQTSANKFAIMTGTGTSIGTPPAISTNTVYTALVNSKTCYLDGTQFATIANSDPSAPRTAHAYLFTWNAATITGGKCRVYSLKIYDENGNAIRDFIPVRRGTTGYLYDRVSGKLFGNAGTGDFVLGPDVVPVEYLQSTGTQWIATGLGAGWTSSSIKIAATLKFTDLSTGEHDLAGSGNAATPTMGRNGSNYFMWAKGGTTWYPTGCDTNWHKVSYTFNNPSGRVFELDGALYSGTQDNTFATGDGIHIFASGPNRYPLNCQLAKLEIWQNGVIVRKFLSVRVGTEGAAMDVLTRRIYRNDGTGAFTYGNDLPYPIPA